MNFFPSTLNDKSVHMPLRKRNIYNQSGLAAAVYLGNQKKQLPIVHFRMAINKGEHSLLAVRQFIRLPGNFTVRLEGGLLVKVLSASFAETCKHLSTFEQIEFCRAVEADVINLLVGSLSEAKFVALQDNEPFNFNLVYLHALQFYGGKANFRLVNEYMEYFMPNKNEREQKLVELFVKAYDFINTRSHWNAVVSLAEFILQAIKVDHKMAIDCDQLIALMEPETVAIDGQYSPLPPDYLETLTAG